MKILDTQFDGVISGKVAFGKATYNEALEKLIPLIDKTEFQRKLQDKKFYSKLERDIADGCVMPPITVAFVTTKELESDKEIEDYINENIGESFVLDKGQRSESRCNRGLPDAAWTEVNDGDAGGSPGGAASAGRQCRGYRLG